ncbi:DUF5916 domain-containing protein [Longimicrobium sp.]|uniref:DUF5916 domain-containing protein n=1 Tax=Longimicrobium sp. TaxID=2029185 RepID=UPI002E326564|nr:DUF5916 domain-containing protein [Longimicrobium sp.]HEX6038194.1 DUF5916 domain-containing protein [Longimicrobium sp.]
MKQYAFLLAAAVLPASAHAQAGHGSASVPGALATRAPSAIHLDGRLDDAAWAAATPITTFTQMDPEEGRPASEATEARILYDDEALYVGVRMHDRGRVNTRLGRRDMNLGDSDWAGVVIDSYHDHRTAYSFDVNPSGVRRDALKTDGGDDMTWDAVWDAAAHRDSAGWTAEYRIPFSQLRFSPATEQTWGIQVERIIGRRNEYDVFSFTPKAERGGVARFGHLDGLRDIRPGRRLEVLPYTVMRADYTDPGVNPFREDGEYGTTVGADLKYRVTSDLTLDATINPDFGQVEQDPADVNLTQFETFFAEKRPFFVEGAEIFTFGPGQLPTGGELFYTRRIGGRASGLAPQTALADVPVDARIVGAAKLSGKTAGGWSIGVLEALTRREEARFRLPDGGSESMVVEPVTNYFVGRLRRDLRGGQSAVGAMVTAVNRDLETDELRSLLHSGGYTAGLDFRHEFGNRAWRLSGFLSGSHVRGDSLAIARTQARPHRYFQRLDAWYVDLDRGATSLTGAAAQLRLQRQAGRHWRGSLGVSTITPGYEVNDLGYQRRGDRIDVNSSVSYVQNTPGRLFRWWQADLQNVLEHSYGGYMVQNSLYLGAQGQTRQYWTVQATLGASAEATDDRLTRGGVLARRPAWRRLTAYAESDGRKPLVGLASVFYQDEDGPGWQGETGVQLTVKASPRWNLSAGPSLSRYVTPAQFLGAGPDASAARTAGYRFFFADLDQTTVTLDTRVNYTFSPELSLEVFVQPFVSTVDFGDVRTLAAARTFTFDASDDSAPGDFTVRSLRGNALLRWEWRRGSTLFLAWQQSRESEELGYADFDLAHERAALFRARPDNVFVLKVNYWLNP